MTLATIWAEAGRLLNDPNNQRWSQDILTTRANEAATIIQGYTDALKTDETLTATANTQAVSLDSDTMDVVRVVIERSNGDEFPLDGTTEDDLDINYPNWRNWDPGEPKTWFYKANNQTLNLVPKPDSNNAISNGITVTEIRKPAAMSAPGDIPFDSNAQLAPYEYAIVSYVVGRCWADDGTPEALAKSKFFRSGSMARPGEFENEIMRINSQFDNPQVPSNIHFQKQGGRLGGMYFPDKSNPLA